MASKSKTTTIALEALPIFLLKYADDIALISPSSEHLQPSVDRLQTYLIVNAEKSYVMAVGGNLRKEFGFEISFNGKRLH